MRMRKGVRRGGGPPPGVFFRLGAPLESRFGRARTEIVLESNQEYTYPVSFPVAFRFPVHTPQGSADYRA